MAVFPEQMDMRDEHDVRKSLARIERYIAYMTERVEFANRNSEKAMTELSAKLAALEEKLAALEQTPEVSTETESE